ncbi:MAG: hypothetical protein F6K47_11430 [Symploca sp. SIO2E6]|nr:hypothetical protein [Symploca sp. SIO2E6]
MGNGEWGIGNWELGIGNWECFPQASGLYNMGFAGMSTTFSTISTASSIVCHILSNQS